MDARVQMGVQSNQDCDVAPHTATDIVIAGGGLAGSLIAWALHLRRPDLSIKLIERGERLGGDHTWSFHGTDISEDMMAWLQPLIVHAWPAQQVIFPSHRRRLGTSYHSITSDRLADVIGTALGERVIYQASIDAVRAQEITLTDGRKIGATAVIDCMGDRANPHLDLGFQKFVGQEIRFAEPHGLADPIIMDASVPQLDGYRFVYVLPFDEHTALVEDTRYADGAALDVGILRQDIIDYIATKGWRIDKIIREEEGVLPIALGGDLDAAWHGSDVASSGVAKAGMAAGLFHPLTGYSLPLAATLAQKIAAHDDLSSRGLFELTHDYAQQQWKQGSFYRFLCRMLFRAAKPEQRYKVMQRFYKLPQPLIERFYAGVSTTRDKARILTGKPPVPIGKALTCLPDRHKLALKRAESIA